MTVLVMTMGDVVLRAQCLETPTAKALIDAAPFEATVNTWGDEVYFPTPVSADLEDDARDVLQAGEMAFWLAGDCIALGFGPTPVSRGDEIRLASVANIWGRALDDVKILAMVPSGAQVCVEVES
jgi:hypothetical protein